MPRIELTTRGRVVVVPLDAAAIGPCALVSPALPDLKGERFVDLFTLRCTVLPLARNMPPEFREEHAVRVVLGELSLTRVAPGAGAVDGAGDALKVVHRTNG